MANFFGEKERRVETRKNGNHDVNYGLIARKTIENLFDTFQTSKKGLSEGQAIRARNEYGDNKISYGKKTPFFIEMVKAYITPFTLVLIGLGITSFITDVVIVAPEDRDFFGSSIIFAMVLISGTTKIACKSNCNRKTEEQV